MPLFLQYNKQKHFDNHCAKFHFDMFYIYHFEVYEINVKFSHVAFFLFFFVCFFSQSIVLVYFLNKHLNRISEEKFEDTN